MKKNRTIVCDIYARTAEPISVLEQIAQTCARDIGQPLVIKSSHSTAAGAEPVVTLHLPAELATSQHQVWCLVCRLACFCPNARISVLVSATAAFVSRPRSRRIRHAA